MFIGEYSHSVDPKNRLAIPSKFRGELGEKVIVTRGLDRCLSVYTLGAWEGVTEKLSSLSLGDPESRSFVRIMLSGAVDVEIDKQGRVLLPEYLKQYAGIERDVVIAGLLDRLEIWNKDQWDKYSSQAEKDTDKTAQKLGELGLY